MSWAWQGLSGRLEAEDKGAANTRALDCGGEGGQSPPGVEAMRARQERGWTPHTWRRAPGVAGGPCAKHVWVGSGWRGKREAHLESGPLPSVNTSSC